MTLHQVLALLRRECDKAGGQAAWAKAAGVSPAYVSDVLQGRREPGEGILRPLGVEKVVTYRRARRNG
jgi:DNA-binding transcriptional regulator YdaS (Cro superfamily)